MIRGVFVRIGMGQEYKYDSIWCYNHSISQDSKHDHPVYEQRNMIIKHKRKIEMFVEKYKDLW